MYYENELSNIKKNWVTWLASFQINDKRVISKDDRSKIQISIANNFHKQKLAKFKIQTDKKSKDVFVTRLE